MVFDSYAHFKNYCLKIAKNKEHAISDEQKNIINEFENVVNLLENLKNYFVIKYYNSILDVICGYFKAEEFDTAFSHLKDFLNKIDNFFKGEIDFYYITTSLNTMLNLEVEFTEQFILNEDARKSVFYPSRIRAVEFIEEEEKIYTINEIDVNYKNKYGVYFIYDDKNELVYIGKSTSCLLSRALKSAEERKTLNFSKIELRECINKSDVAIYEAYYISLYKPIYNSELVFNDIPSIELPDLKCTKVINRNVENEYVICKYTYYKVRVIEIDEFLSLQKKGIVCIATSEKIKQIRENGIGNKYEMQQKAYKDSIAKIKANGRYIVKSDIIWN